VGVLVGIALVAGMVTAISPCVLPVLPIVFAGSASGGRRRPYAIAAGLVLGFTAFTLAATALLDALGLPEDLLRDAAIGVVVAMGVSLLLPRLGDLLERPFRRLGRRAPGDVGGGVVLGVSLGLLFTPCAGPIIGTVAFVAATRRFSAEAVVVTLAYALGAGVVLLALALAARRGLDLRPLRARAPLLRRSLGAVIAAVGILMALGLDTRLQTKVPGYLDALRGLEESAAASARLARLAGTGAPAAESRALEDLGVAPGFPGIRLWLNSKPLRLGDLQGKVVLVDFWTYSCINCLRTLPYLERWYETYARDGLVIVGVHTPEFAFERVPVNVGRAVEGLGVRYPVALDSDYTTWNAWRNQYWPAEYFLDRRGHVRFVHFGEGEYERKEQVIRRLLAEPGLPPPVSGSLRDETPTGPQTPETYLGYSRLGRYAGDTVRAGEAKRYRLAGLVPPDAFSYGGEWNVESERAVAGADARLRLRYRAGRVFLVLGPPRRGPGRVGITLDGKRLSPVTVDEHRLYQLAVTLPTPAPGDEEHVLDLSFTPGVEAYAFTFGS
jgi:cytochrome c biogenesis protein CcdA/thiol-disulfide isomerase/thioredoxin